MKLFDDKLFRVLVFLSFCLGLLISLNSRKTITTTEFVEVNNPFILKQVRVSSYCPCVLCCGRYADGITALGYPAIGYLVAAPEIIPEGTMLKIPGYAAGKAVPVLDRGGAIKGNSLDVFFPLHQQALDFGIQFLDIEVIK